MPRPHSRGRGPAAGVGIRCSWTDPAGHRRVAPTRRTRHPRRCSSRKPGATRPRRCSAPTVSSAGWTRRSPGGATEDVGASSVDVRFHIEEGTRTFVRSVRFEGLPRGVAPPALPMLRPGEPFSSHPAGGGRRRHLRRAGAGELSLRPGDGAGRLLRGPDHRRAGARGRPGARGAGGSDGGARAAAGRTRRWSGRTSRWHRGASRWTPRSSSRASGSCSCSGCSGRSRCGSSRPDTPEPVKDVVVEARERSRLSGSVGVGYSLEDGPRHHRRPRLPERLRPGDQLHPPRQAQLRGMERAAAPGLRQRLRAPGPERAGLQHQRRAVAAAHLAVPPGEGGRAA